MEKTRRYWPVPDDDELRRDIEEADAATREERVARYRDILREFGPPAHMFLVGGIPAMLAINELQRAFILGNFLGVILLAQVFIEHSLGGDYGARGNDDVAKSGLAALIDQACEDRVVSPALALRLHDLRRMRNPYIHHHSPPSRRGYIRRLLERGPEPFALAEDDARLAIQILGDFMREGSPNWRPSPEP